MMNTFTMEVTTENEVLTIGVEIDQTENELCEIMLSHIDNIMTTYKRCGTAITEDETFMLRRLLGTFGLVTDEMADEYGTEYIGQLYVDVLDMFQEEFEEIVVEIANA